MRILVVAGSSRRRSLNHRLARMVVDVRTADDVELVRGLDLLPFYDADLEAAGTPAPVERLRDAVHAADLLVMVTPEYNGTVPGLLANAVDWLSRPHRASALGGKPALVLSASPTPAGGANAAAPLRAVLARAGSDVIPTGLSVAVAHTRLTADTVDPQLFAALDALLAETSVLAEEGAA